jgi:AcrR family transcriptional regulator
MLDAAVTEFARHGFHAAGMDEIAARAGVSKPMVYLYLGSKEELFTACLHREGTRLMQAIVDAVTPADADRRYPPDEQLWRGLEAFFTFVDAHRDGWAVLYREARGVSGFSGDLAAMRERMVDALAGLLARAVAVQGRPASPTDLRAMAYALVGAAESTADWFVDLEHADPGAAATRLMNLLWLGSRSLLHGETWLPPSAG